MSNPKLEFQRKRSKIHQFCISVLFFNLVGCAASLSPQYNQAIVDNLSSATKETMRILTVASGGTKSNDFSTREAGYNSAIGILEALKLQIQSRPSPKSKTLDTILKKVNERLKARGLPEVKDINPSLKAIEQISANISKMKEVDKIQGVTKEEVDLFKGSSILFFDQALTYESFLNK
jgi:hypothetical protein